MDALEQRIERAKEDKDELNSLIAEYLPFIKGQVNHIQNPFLEQEDAQSISMMVFTNCIMQYRIGAGGFLSFVRTCIRNRLIDEGRKTKNSPMIIPLHGDESYLSSENTASLQQYDKEQERQLLCNEIDELSSRLNPFGITFTELPLVCPKQCRAREQCLEIAAYIVGDKAVLHRLLQQRKLPQSELARQFNLSVKTIEKHRKYIVTLAILLTGDYPCIQAFLPQWKEVL